MAQIRTFQSNLTGGELSPSMYSRPDIGKYQTGVKTARNVIIKPQGGMRARSGTVFVGEIADSADRGFQLPFDIGPGESYVLEFGDQVLRFIRDGAYVLDGTMELAVSATATSPAVFTNVGHGLTTGDRVYVDQTEIEAPQLFGRFFTVTVLGPNTFTLTDLWGAAVNLSAVITAGRVTREYSITTPYALSAIDRLNFAQDQAVAYLLNRAYEVQKLTRIAADNWTIGLEDFTPDTVAPGTSEAYATDQVLNTVSVSAANPAIVTLVGHGFSTGNRYAFSSADSNGQDLLNQVFTITNLTGNTFRLDGYDRSAMAVSTARGQRGTSPDILYAYQIAAIDEDTGEESLPSIICYALHDLSVAGAINRITWATVAGASRYIVYKEDNGVFGYIGGTTGLTFDDENITPDLSDTVQQGRNPFAGAGNYPGCGTFFEQRLVLASTLNNPAGVWASQSANPSNFGVSSPLKASDAITFRVRASRVTQIEALVPTETLLMLTRGGEWTVRGGNQEDYLTPTNIVLRQPAFRGSTDVPPVLAGEFVVHTQRGGNAVRDLNLEREVKSTELSLLSKHFLRNRYVVSMAYQQNPDSVIWVVLDNGTLLALTYMLEHDIWGWTKMELGGTGVFVEAVTVVEEADGDAVYLQVRRTINGASKRYIERFDIGEPDLAEDAYHVDCGYRYEFGSPVSQVLGLNHLEGETLVALLDGNVVRDLEVIDGAVTLPVPASKINIGLGYTAVIRTLDLDVGATKDAGSLLGRFKSIAEVTLRVENTRGIFVAHETSSRAVEYKQRAGEAWDAAIDLFTGDVQITPQADWTTGGNLLIEQRDPLPMTINGILIDWEFGE